MHIRFIVLLAFVFSFCFAFPVFGEEPSKDKTSKEKPTGEPSAKHTTDTSANAKADPATSVRKGIVVWRLERKAGVTKDDIDSISGIVTSEVERFSGAQVTSEADIQTLLKTEEKIKKCGAEETACMAEIGAAFGVPKAVSGDLGKVGETWVLNLRLINIKTAEVMGRASRQMDGDIDDLMMVVPGGVAELFGKPQPPMPAILKVESDPKGALVKAGNLEIGKTPVKKRMKAGEREFHISKKGYLPQTRKAALQAGKKMRLSFELTKIEMSPHKKAAYGTFFSGLAFAAAGGAFLGVSKMKMDARDDALQSGNASKAQDARDASKIFGGLGIGALAIGGASMVTGIILWAIAPDDAEWMQRKTKPDISPTPDGKGGMVSVKGGF